MQRLLCFILFAGLVHRMDAEPAVSIRTDFPGGNALIRTNSGSTVHLEPDLRGDRPWFYWLFEAKALRPGEVTFVFPQKVIGFLNGAIGFQGPAISLDAGKTWDWMGTERVTKNKFAYGFKEAGEVVRFGVTIPYTKDDLMSFLQARKGNPHFIGAKLTNSRKGRTVELVRIGKPGAAKKSVLITARHHAAETMASFVVEGILDEAMSEQSEAGRLFRERHVLFAVPLVDKDGVEEGDQGKNRKPHDHNRDYTDAPIYPEVKAIQELHRREQFAYALDVHCPTLVMDIHQVMYFVGAKVHPPRNFEKVTAFAQAIKERLPKNAPHGPLVWLRDEKKVSPKNSRWFAFQKGMIMSATLEVPFAPKGRAADVESCREYGRAILRAFVATPFEKFAAVHEAPTFDEAAQIRDAVAVRCDWGSASAQIKMGIFTDDWAALEKLIDADRHAVMCQGAAYALHLKYKSLGYRSYLIGLQNSEYSHAMCLVEVKIPNGEPKLVVMDPSFNVSFTDPEGTPLSIYELITLANRGQAHKVRVVEGKPVDTLYLQSKQDPLSKSHPYRGELKYSTAEFDVYAATLSLERFATAHHAHITRACEREGLPISAVSATFVGEPLYIHILHLSDVNGREGGVR